MYRRGGPCGVGVGVEVLRAMCPVGGLYVTGVEWRESGRRVDEHRVRLF